MFFMRSFGCAFFILKDGKITEDFHKRLKKERLKRGLTQQNIADIIGVERSAYAKYEKSALPPLNKLVKLCRALEVSADYLIGADKRA